VTAPKGLPRTVADLNRTLGDLTTSPGEGTPADLATRVSAVEDLLLVLADASPARPEVDAARAAVRRASGRSQ
jgi:hypothetical protein